MKKELDNMKSDMIGGVSNVEREVGVKVEDWMMGADAEERKNEFED